MSKFLTTSAKMAVVMGVLLPTAETVRRIHQVLALSDFFDWFDDYILGGILLGAAYLVFKKRKNAVAYLIAAWGIGAGALFLSFIAQFNYYNGAEPGIFSTTLVAVAKGLILTYMLVGLNLAIKANS